MQILNELEVQKGSTCLQSPKSHASNLTKESPRPSETNFISQSFLESTPITEKPSNNSHNSSNSSYSNSNNSSSSSHTWNYDSLQKVNKMDTLRPSTLPRTNFESPILVKIDNSLNQGDDRVDIDESKSDRADTPKAFLTKSPPPILKNKRNHYHYNNHQQTKNFRGLRDDESKEIMPDLLRSDNDDCNQRGSNMSIGQLSNVASSGYQSINNFSQSNSPVDFRNVNRLNGGRIYRNGSFENSYELRRFARNHSKNITSLNRPTAQALAFTNPVYSSSPKQLLENSSSDEHLDKRPLLCNNCLNSDASSSLNCINR